MIRICATAVLSILLLGVGATAVAAQEDCAITSTCPAQNPPPTPKSKPASRPVADPCDTRWRTATGGRRTIAKYSTFIAECPRDPRARIAQSEIDKIRASLALQDRSDACSRRYGDFRTRASSLTYTASVSSSSSFIAQASELMRECPAGNSRSANVRPITDAIERAKLNLEMDRWGLTYRQMCGHAMYDVITLAGVRNRRVELQRAAQGDDSVAKVLQGYLLESESGWAVEQKNEALALYALAAERNPRAQVMLAENQLFRPSPQTAAADRSLGRARSENCAYAYLRSAARAYGSFPEGEPPANLGSTPIQLLIRASDFGSPEAKCWLATAKAPGDDKRFFYDWQTREKLLEEAATLGFGCGRATYAAYGEPGYYLAGEPARGFCANDRNCILRILRDEFRTNPRSTGDALFAFLVSGELGGGSRNNAEAVQVLKRHGEVGSLWAKRYLGEAYLFGDLGLAPDIGQAFNYCLSAANMGDGKGAACVYFAAGEEKGFATAAALKKAPCAFTEFALRFLPSFSVGTDSVRPEDVTNIRKGLSEMSPYRYALLKQRLGDIETALNAVGATDESCAVRARAFSRSVTQVIRPYFDGYAR